MKELKKYRKMQSDVEAAQYSGEYVRGMCFTVNCLDNHNRLLDFPHIHSRTQGIQRVGDGDFVVKMGDQYYVVLMSCDFEAMYENIPDEEAAVVLDSASGGAISLKEIHSEEPNAQAFEINPNSRYLLVLDSPRQPQVLTEFQAFLNVEGFQNVIVCPFSQIKLYEIEKESPCQNASNKSDPS